MQPMCEIKTAFFTIRTPEVTDKGSPVILKRLQLKSDQPTEQIDRIQTLNQLLE